MKLTKQEGKPRKKWKRRLLTVVACFLVLFVAVITGVGGGVMRDLFAGDRPYIFVKHVYACAALLGAIAFAALKPLVGLDGATVIGFALIVVIRFCSARFHWSLPKARL